MTAAAIENEEIGEEETVNTHVAAIGDDQGLHMADEEREM